ncbi:MAG: hypothetical protein HON53_09050 [Planctomycetaceae bacterium]|jgi:hypothetical protein|nr:hypothetical protein [Planctomycetaceae bacterium]MBT6155996.1 hypothetical protein [Planctomycetaceae bacterium]MBT6484972.1 hypothetical protein [Planctomycetaceae bacterium]
MQSTDEQKPVIEEQYDQILKLKRRLLVATCVAAVSTAAFLGIAILLGVTYLADGSGSRVGRREAEMQRMVAQQAQQAQQVAMQQTMRANQLAQQVAAQQQTGVAQDDMGMMGAGGSAAGDFGADAFGAGSSMANDEEPVVAPVPSTE